MKETIKDEFLSLNNFQRAWEKVAANQGCAGIDEETIADFANHQLTNITQLRDAVANSTYQPLPCKQMLIPKKKGSWRELRVPTVRDRIVQQALLNVLHPLMDAKFSDSSFAYRPNLSYLDAVKKIAFWRDLGYQWVLDADIVDYFNNINHQRLLSEVRKFVDNSGILCLIKAWITAGISTDKVLIFPEKGIPQGAVISPILANIYLHEFDLRITESGLKLVRYADDFLVLSDTQDGIMLAYSQVVQLLMFMGLEIHEDKTQITHFRKGFQFLGHGFLHKAIFPIESDTQASKSSRKKKRQSLISSNISEEVSSESSSVSEIKKEKSPRIIFLEWLQSKQRKKTENNSQLSADRIKLFWNKEMATIYLMEQGTYLQKEHERFIIQVSETQKIEILMREIERILVFGNIQLTTPTINACLSNNIMVLFLNQSGQYNGHLWSLNTTHITNEMVQIRRHQDKTFQFMVSQAIVYGKLLNSKRLLMRLNRKRKVTEIDQAIKGINSDIENLKLVENLDQLRGYEGVGAARYFPAFGQLITNSAFSFSLRNRQPPTDPVNALLSFGYTLLFNNVLSLIIAEGLSPYLGNFHYGERGKSYLAFDLMEEFRAPIVDGLVLKVINNSLLNNKDFDPVASNGGIYLSDSGRRIFIKEFESRMNRMISHPDIQSPVSYRQAIQLQIRRYKQSLLSDVSYQSFVRTM